MNTRFLRLMMVAIVIMILSLAALPVSADNGTKLFITSAVENPDDTVTLPLYRGTSQGQTVYYIILDTSNGALADQLGVNRSQKLANLAGNSGVQPVTIGSNGIWNFPGTVNFATVGDAQPRAQGDANYSPLVQLPDGTIVNAPQIANNSGRANKVLSLDTANMRVVYKETHGFSNGRPVRYVSTDASSVEAAVLENVTYAPKLGNAVTFGDDSTASGLTSLAILINGQTGANNPQRQGLNSALLDGLDPLNILRWTPNQGRYSPLWDVYPAVWTAQAIAGGQNLRQTDWGDLQNLVDHGLVTGPDGAPFASGRFIVNCPIVSQQ